MHARNRDPDSDTDGDNRLLHIRHIIGTDNFAGVERYVVYTATELADRGHRVEVVGGHGPTMESEFAGTGVEFSRAPSIRAALGVHARGSRPDIVHSHMTAADMVSVATAPRFRCPRVSTIHFAQPRGHDCLTRALYGIVPKLLTAQISISEFVASRLGSPSEVIPNGVPDPSAGSTSGSERLRVVLATQRLEAEKNTALVVEAFANSGLAGEGWELHIAGEGKERPELEKLVDSLGLTESTHFLGRVDDVARRMSQAGIFMASAHAEPFGLAVVEAMAAGLPVVAADGGAHRETIGAVTSETMFPVGDADRAAEIIRNLADDPVKRGELSARVRRGYLESFTVVAHVDRLEALYRRIAR